MVELMDFNGCPESKAKMYGGSVGMKRRVFIDGEAWMLKFPGHAKVNDALSYRNSSVAEYLACHIFELAGIPVQETMLGTTDHDGKEWLVVACKDFTENDRYIVQDFTGMKSSVLATPQHGSGTEISSIEETIGLQEGIDPDEVLDRFWDMFVVDALIGNWDRHNGNWGFLFDPQRDELKLAPVYDCGSGMYPGADKAIMKGVLEGEGALNVRVYERPTSTLHHEGRRVNYHDFMLSGKNPHCDEAILRIVPRLDVSDIEKMIDETPGIDDLQRDFYKKMMVARKELILDVAHARALERKQQRSRELEPIALRTLAEQASEAAREDQGPASAFERERRPSSLER